MIVTKITTHVQDALARLMQEYKNSEQLQDILSALVDQVQDIEDATYDVDNGRMLYNGTTYPAIGVQLDAIGDIVGFARNGLPDDQYLLFILGKIAVNFSDATIATILYVANAMFENPVGFKMYEIYPAAIALSFQSTIVDPVLFPTIAALIQKALGAGIGLSFISQGSQSNPFSFKDQTGGVPPLPNSHGFDDLLSPGQGGLFADLIYANPNT